MSGKYLKYIPKTLQEDFIDNRVIPFVGAGFSKNAIAPEGASILDYAVLFGGKAVIVDPKSERGNWQETLPDIAHEIKIVNLTSEDKDTGYQRIFITIGKQTICSCCQFYPSDRATPEADKDHTEKECHKIHREQDRPQERK